MSGNLRTDGGLWDDSKPVYTGPCGSEWPPMWVEPAREVNFAPPGWPDPRGLFRWTPEELQEAVELGSRMAHDVSPNLHGNAIAHRIRRHAKEAGLATW